MKFWLIIGAAVVATWWWTRRAQAAMAGTGNPTGAPRGASGAGVLAAMKARPKLSVLQGGKGKGVKPAKKLPPVGHGRTAPSNLQQKPTAKRAPASLPKPNLSNKPAGAR